MWKIVTSAAAGLAIGALLVGWFALTQVSGLRGQVNSQRSKLGSYASELSSDRSLISQLQDKMGSLSTPQDPLSAYDDICNAQLTNSTTGLTQTYYYPCTNNAETIPQPGN